MDGFNERRSARIDYCEFALLQPNQWCGNQLDRWTIFNTGVIHCLLLTSDLTLQPQSHELGSMGGGEGLMPSDELLVDDSDEEKVTMRAHHGRRMLDGSQSSDDESASKLTLDFSDMNMVDWLALLHVFTSTLKVLVYILEGPLDQYRTGIRERLVKLNQKKSAKAKRELRIRPKRGHIIPLEVTKTVDRHSLWVRFCTSSCCRSRQHGEISLIEAHVRSVSGDDCVESITLEHASDPSSSVACVTVLLRDETAADATLSALQDLYRVNSYQLINTPETIEESCRSDGPPRASGKGGDTAAGKGIAPGRQQLVTVNKKTARFKEGRFVHNFFKQVDRDNSGTLTEDELSAAMRYDLKMQLTDHEVHEHFQAMDAAQAPDNHDDDDNVDGPDDTDNKLDLAELQKIFCKEPFEVQVSKTLDHEIKPTKTLNWLESLAATRHLLIRKSLAETLWTCAKNASFCAIDL
jgi:hypothetical protein